MPPSGNGVAHGLQMMDHGLRVGMWQDQSNGQVLLGAKGAKNIRRFRLLLAHDARLRSFARPDPGQRTALPNTHFILKPDVDLLTRDARWQEGLHFLIEVFF